MKIRGSAVCLGRSLLRLFHGQLLLLELESLLLLIERFAHHVVVRCLLLLGGLHELHLSVLHLLLLGESCVLHCDHLLLEMCRSIVLHGSLVETGVFVVVHSNEAVFKFLECWLFSG